MYIKTSLLLLGIAFSISSCNDNSVANGNDKETLSRRHSEIIKPFVENPQTVDYNSFLTAHYAEDAVMMIPNMAPVRGRDSIINFWQTAPMKFTRFQVNDEQVETSGNLGFIRGTYEMSFVLPDSTKVEDQGNYIEVWRKNDKGEWQCIQDISNSIKPMAPQTQQ